MLSCFNLGLDHLIVEIITLSYLYVPLCTLLNKNTFDMLIGTWSDHPGQQCNHKSKKWVALIKYLGTLEFCSFTERARGAWSSGYSSALLIICLS